MSSEYGSSQKPGRQPIHLNRACGMEISSITPEAKRTVCPMWSAGMLEAGLWYLELGPELFVCLFLRYAIIGMQAKSL